jgi:predicted esterase
MKHDREPTLGSLAPTTRIRGRCAALLLILLLGAGPARAASRGDARGIVDGSAKCGMTYHLSVSPTYDARKGLPAIVVLHGSNMSSKVYVQTMLSAWPRLSQRYIIIGIDGENRVKGSPDSSPAYNYTYVNYAGKSKYRGFPGSDRESPALIPEVLAEIKEKLHIGKVFIGGHSQGGFCAYSTFMNFPELFAGAFPVSAGLIIQCEPSAYEDEKIRGLQRKVALAIVHGETDDLVDLQSGRSAHEAFLEEGFPAIRLFSHKTAGHRFGPLPIEDAVGWLEEMSEDNPRVLLKTAERRIVKGEYRDALACLQRARELDAKKAHGSAILSLEKKVNGVARAKAKAMEKALKEAKDDSWVADFTEFQRSFELTEAARPAMDEYRKLRAAHEKPAEELWLAARRDFQAGKREAALEKCREIVKSYFASSYYRYAKRALK